MNGIKTWSQIISDQKYEISQLKLKFSESETGKKIKDLEEKLNEVQLIMKNLIKERKNRWGIYGKKN